MFLFRLKWKWFWSGIRWRVWHLNRSDIYHVFTEIFITLWWFISVLQYLRHRFRNKKIYEIAQCSSKHFLGIVVWSSTAIFRWMCCNHHTNIDDRDWQLNSMSNYTSNPNIEFPRKPLMQPHCIQNHIIMQISLNFKYSNKNRSIIKTTSFKFLNGKDTNKIYSMLGQSE